LIEIAIEIKDKAIRAKLAGAGGGSTIGNFNIRTREYKKGFI